MHTYIYIATVKYNEEKPRSVQYEESEVMTQLYSSKIAAIAKMKLYGGIFISIHIYKHIYKYIYIHLTEEWAEKEESPTYIYNYIYINKIYIYE
jgi:hypothetical protein